MEPVLESIELSIELNDGEMVFRIDGSQVGNIKATLDSSVGNISRQLEEQYEEVALASKDMLSAIVELRGAVRFLGQATYPYFSYKLDARKRDLVLTICDCDPSRHRTLFIQGYTVNLSETEPRSIAFLDAIANSGICEHRPYWDASAIYVRLKPEFAHPSNLLETYRKLLRLY